MKPTNSRVFLTVFRARSSGVEHSPFKRGAVSSNLTGRTFLALFVYRLGRRIFNPKRGVQLS